MPHFKIMGLNKKGIAIFEDDVITKIASIANCPEKSIKIWLIDNSFVESSSERFKQDKIFIEIAWKKRSEVVMREMAQYINLLFKNQLTYITFTNIEESYYVDGIK